MVKVLGDHVYGYEGLPEWTAANTSFCLEITVKEPAPPEPGKKRFQASEFFKLRYDQFLELFLSPHEPKLLRVTVEHPELQTIFRREIGSDFKH